MNKEYRMSDIRGCEYFDIPCSIFVILENFLPEKQKNQNLGTTPRPGLRPEEVAA